MPWAKAMEVETYADGLLRYSGELPLNTLRSLLHTATIEVREAMNASLK